MKSFFFSRFGKHRMFPDIRYYNSFHSLSKVNLLLYYNSLLFLCRAWFSFISLFSILSCSVTETEFVSLEVLKLEKQICEKQVNGIQIQF